MTNPPIPEPPSGDSFSTQTHVNALIAIKVLRIDPNWPDKFNRNEGRPVSATFFDIWVLDGAQDTGAFLSNVVNTSMLGAQLAGSVGTTFYGRIVADRRNSGTAYVLGNPFPNDGPIIEAHKARMAAEAAAPRASGGPQHQYQNEPAWQEPAAPPPPRQDSLPAEQPPAQTYSPAGYGASTAQAPANDKPPF